MLDFYKLLFDKLHVNYCQSWLTERLKELPYMNSLFGVKTILSIYGIDSSCVRLPQKDELHLVNIPCIALFDDNFVIVESITNDKVKFSAPKIGSVEISSESFAAKWNGYIILIYKKTSSGEPDYREHLKDERLSKAKASTFWLAIGAIAVIILCQNQLHYQWQWWALSITNVAGCCVSYLLLKKQLHIPTQIGDKLCGLVHNSHCEDVTNSDGATIMGLVKLSEIGTAFFFVNLAGLFIVPEYIFFFALAGVAVLPFSFWSIWYQKYKVRSWCVMCLMILGLMWLQTAIYLAGGYFHPENAHWWMAIILSSVYCLAALSINKIMTVLEKKQQGEQWHAKYNLLKSDDKVVSAIENEAPTFKTTDEECSEMLFGDPEAPIEITVFSNPYCSPCAKLHNQIKNLPGKNVKIRYILTYFTDDLSAVNRMLIASYQQLGSETTWDIMTKWYDNGKTEGIHFFDSYKLKDNTESVKKEFQKQKDWRNENILNGTPTIIINSKEIVAPYSVQDYIYIPNKFK